MNFSVLLHWQIDLIILLLKLLSIKVVDILMASSLALPSSVTNFRLLHIRLTMMFKNSNVISILSPSILFPLESFHLGKGSSVTVISVIPCVPELLTIVFKTYDYYLYYQRDLSLLSEQLSEIRPRIVKVLNSLRQKTNPLLLFSMSVASCLWAS